MALVASLFCLWSFSLTTSPSTKLRTRSPISGEMSEPNCMSVVRKRFSLLSWRAPQAGGSCWEEPPPARNGGDGVRPLTLLCGECSPFKTWQRNKGKLHNQRAICERWCKAPLPLPPSGGLRDTTKLGGVWHGICTLGSGAGLLWFGDVKQQISSLCGSLFTMLGVSRGLQPHYASKGPFCRFVRVPNFKVPT